MEQVEAARSGFENRLRDQNRECEQLARQLEAARSRRRRLVTKLVFLGGVKEDDRPLAYAQIEQICEGANRLDGSRKQPQPASTEPQLGER